MLYPSCIISRPLAGSVCLYYRVLKMDEVSCETCLLLLKELKRVVTLIKIISSQLVLRKFDGYEPANYNVKD